MSVISMSNRQTRRAAGSNRGGAQAPTIREADEFEGFWVNVGPVLPDGTFARLNRGIAVSDLRIQQIYETTDPARKAELTLLNSFVRAIQAKANGKALAEGEHIVLKNLQVVLYRRMEGSEGETTASLDAQVEDLLFGDDEQDPAAKQAAEESDAAFEAEVERRLAERLAAAGEKKAPAGGSKRRLEIDED